LDGVIRSITLLAENQKKGKRLVASNRSKESARRALQNALTIVSPSEVGKALGKPDTGPLLLQQRGIYATGHPGIKFDWADAEAFGRKLVRGFARHLWGKILAPDQIINVRMLVSERSRTTMREVFQKWQGPWRRLSIGSGSLDLVSLAAYDNLEITASIWCFLVWDEYYILATLPDPGAVAAAQRLLRLAPIQSRRRGRRHGGPRR
jgi:hypothetical protein